MDNYQVKWEPNREWLPWLHPSLTRNFRSSRFGPRRGALFLEPAPLLRPMKVLVDARLVELARLDERAKYLMELLAEDHVEAHLYSPGGPPTTAQRVTTVRSGIEGVQGWALTTPGQENRTDVIFREGNEYVRRATQLHEPLLSHLTYRSGSPEVDQGDRKFSEEEIGEAKSLIVAKAMKADLYIVPSRLRFEPSDPQWWTTTVLTPRDAVPLVGLYLRRQSVFLLSRTPALGQPFRPVEQSACERTFFYWEAADTLLSSHRSWESTCRYFARERGRSLGDLPQALTWRLDQILRARDRILAHLAVVPMSHDTVDDIVTDLDLILSFLMASFDITARAAHTILLLSGETRGAGWQKDRWVAKVRRSHLDLGELFQPNSQGKNLMTALAELRNTVHEYPFSAGGRVFIVGAHPLEPVIRIPPDILPKLLGAFACLGGQASWGVIEPRSSDDHYYLHAGRFAEQVISASLAKLDEVLAQIAAVDDSAAWSNYPRSRRELRMLWQLGLD